MEEEIKKSQKEIEELYKNLENIVNNNPKLYIMPVSIYNEIMKKLGHMEDRIRKQSSSLKKHMKDKIILRQELKKIRGHN